jgi:hypothetical protein
MAPTHPLSPGGRCGWRGISPFSGAKALACQVTQSIPKARTNRTLALVPELADYEQQRNTAVLPMYEFTLQLADLGTLPQGGLAKRLLLDSQPQIL